MSKASNKQKTIPPVESDSNIRKSQLAPEAEHPVKEHETHNQQPNHHQQDRHNVNHNISQRSDFEEEHSVRAEMPSDKDELIEYLKETLKKAEMTMGTVFVAIQIEKDKRNKLVHEIAEKKKEIDETNEQEDKFLTEKVHEKMTIALQKALADKDTAETEFDESKEKMETLESAIKKLDDEIIKTHSEKAKKEVELLDIQHKVNEQESRIDSFQQEMEKLNTKKNDRTANIEKLTAEVNEMKGVVDTLIDVKGKLNDYFKDETPIQSKQGARKERPAQESVFEGVRNSKEMRTTQEESQSELPARSTYTKPAEDDFWYEEKTRYKAGEQKRIEVMESQQWQPKVQYYDLPPERNERGAEYHAPTVKLPNINANRPEYLYKNKEYIDEFGGGNQRTLKKAQVQPKRRPY